ncbi:MAG: hypothetical protein NW224_10885, partial [Leptolyngbyaceae cyanobacterium bins.302]|nr:hypothetical protein [Leptolyngbyaceae cyanobacterium bins.302]
MLLESPPQPIGEKRITFRSLNWAEFKQIHQLLTERTHARFIYDNGILEITMPLEAHERFARLIERFILILVVELGMKIKTMGSTTLDREDLLRSAEPDNGYYIPALSRCFFIFFRFRFTQQSSGRDVRFIFLPFRFGDFLLHSPGVGAE